MITINDLATGVNELSLYVHNTSCTVTVSLQLPKHYCAGSFFIKKDFYYLFIIYILKGRVNMDLLKQRILQDGRVIGNDILKVDSFLNHQIDVGLYNEIGKEFKRLFDTGKITKILTIEASGIGIACITAQYFGVPVIFAKKTESRNLDTATYESEVYSFTKGKSYKIRVSKRFINQDDTILIIDDFLANGKAVLGLKDIIEQADASLAGVGIVIEKGFQDGGRILRNMGINLKSLAIVESMENGVIRLS